MKSTKAELKKNINCVCLQLPCVHNPEVSEDVKIEITLIGETTPKGVKYVYLDKRKFLIVEETATTMKMQVLE